MILGMSAIVEALTSGDIVCDPAPARIEGAHIDVALGEYWWELSVTPTYGEYLDLKHENPCDVFMMRLSAGEIIIPAHGFILAHTQEFIGTSHGSGLVPMLHTRSTLARWGLSVCTANAGQGDEGYASRWTLEIANPHPVAVALPVGARVGSIAFHRVEGDAAPYEARYNALKADWKPSDILPRKGNW